jgi:hypothetical protein
MKKHVKIYLDYFGYDVNSFIDCEVCGSKAVDIHHIEPRGMGGILKGTKDVIIIYKHYAERVTLRWEIRNNTRNF